MSDPALGLLMLTLIVIVIMMGFPTAFTLMGLGMFFGFIAFYGPGASWADNRVRRRDGGRHARHSDCAVGHDHRLCRGRRSVDRQAVRGGDVPRFLPVVPVSHLHSCLGVD